MQYSAFSCFLDKWQNYEILFILNWLRFICSVSLITVFLLISHCARHTYASEITLSQGVPIETVSRMLGHSEIKTTQIYAKITDNKIDEDMKALDNRIAGKYNFAI